MPQAPNKLLSRAEVRAELMNLRNDAAMILNSHLVAVRKDVAHVEKSCRVCAAWRDQIRAHERAIRHFGGRV